jgi:hypothetical protein
MEHQCEEIVSQITFSQGEPIRQSTPACRKTLFTNGRSSFVETGYAVVTGEEVKESNPLLTVVGLC